MKSIFKLFLLGLVLLSVNSVYSQDEIELEDVDSVDAYFILNQIDQIVADENKLDEVLLSFEDLFSLFPDSLTESLTEDDKAEAKTEYAELHTLAKEAFSELRKCIDCKKREIYIYGEELEEGISTFEVEYLIWKGENEDEGADVDFIYFKTDDKIFLIYAEAY